MVNRFSTACGKVATLNRCFMVPSALAVALLIAGPVSVQAKRHTQKATSQAADPVIMTHQPGSALEAEVKKLSGEYLAAAARHHETPLILIGSTPLSKDNKTIGLFVQVQAASLCGSAGCSTDVYMKHAGQWVKILDSVSSPISLLHTTHDGMRDILIDGSDRWIWRNGTYHDTLAATDLPGFKTSIKKHQAEMRKEGHQITQ